MVRCSDGLFCTTIGDEAYRESNWQNMGGPLPSLFCSMCSSAWAATCATGAVAASGVALGVLRTGTDGEGVGVAGGGESSVASADGAPSSGARSWPISTLLSGGVE